MRFQQFLAIIEGRDYPPELAGKDFSNNDARMQDIQKTMQTNPGMDWYTAGMQRPSFEIRQEEQTKAWKYIVTTMFPGGHFGKKPEDGEKDWNTIAGDVMQYHTTMFGRGVDFSLQRDRYGKEMWATVDFGWESQPEISKKDAAIVNGGEVEGDFAGGVANAAASRLQKGSLDFMRTIQNKYILPLHKYGIKVKFNASDEGETSRRTPLYNRMLKNAGYQPVSVYGKKNTFKPDYSAH